MSKSVKHGIGSNQHLSRGVSTVKPPKRAQKGRRSSALRLLADTDISASDSATSQLTDTYFEAVDEAVVESGFRFGAMASDVSCWLEAAGYTPPLFSSPPNDPDMDRSIEREGDWVRVRVRYANRDGASVLRDLIIGGLQANHPNLDSSVVELLLADIKATISEE